MLVVTAASLMSKLLGLPPLLVLFGILPAGQVGGFWGAVFGIPVLAAVVRDPLKGCANNELPTNDGGTYVLRGLAWTYWMRIPRQLSSIRNFQSRLIPQPRRQASR